MSHRGQRQNAMGATVYLDTPMDGEEAIDELEFPGGRVTELVTHLS